jgi:SpoVK/Ycf46/Vps4 family AAA+-type ATPase
LEANGRILIITTNFPERIDRALIRPGRIDLIVNFKKCSVPIMQEMVNAFYDRTDLIVPSLTGLHEKWSPAEVNQILFRNFDTPENAIVELSGSEPVRFQNENNLLSVADPNED